MKKYLSVILIIVLLMLIFPMIPNASKNDLRNRDDVLQFLKAAYHAQVSLSEKDRNMEEIDLLLNRYFSNAYKKNFLEGNLFEENGKFFTYGTDFGQYYIPYLRFSIHTDIVIEKNHIYVFEYFPVNHQGPVGYDNHYEGILIEKLEGEWKVSQYLYNQIPDEVLNRVEKKAIVK